MVRVAQRLLGDRRERQAVTHEVEAIQRFAVEDPPLDFGCGHDGVHRCAAIEPPQIRKECHGRGARRGDSGPVSHESAQHRRLTALEHLASDEHGIARLELADRGGGLHGDGHSRGSGGYQK